MKVGEVSILFNDVGPFLGHASALRHRLVWWKSVGDLMSIVLLGEELLLCQGRVSVLNLLVGKLPGGYLMLEDLLVGR